MPAPEEHGFLIRPYRNKDFSDVTGLESAGVHERYRSAVFVRRMGALAPATFLVAASGTTIVGFTVAAIVEDDPGQAWILRMMVKDGFRHRGYRDRALSGRPRCAARPGGNNHLPDRLSKKWSGCAAVPEGGVCAGIPCMRLFWRR